MKKILLALLVAACLSCVYGFQFIAGQPHSGTSYNTVDVSRGFESSIPSGWTEVDTGGIIDDQSTSQKMHGSYSMEVACSNTYAGHQYYDFGSGKSSVSFSFWYKTPNYVNSSTNNIVVATLSTSSAGMTAGTYAALFAGAYSSSQVIRLRSGTFTSYINLDTNTWYLVETKIVSGGTCSITVKNTSLETISGGYQTIETGNTFSGRYLYFGNNITWDPEYTGYSIYIDSIGVDYTDATYPLWEYEVSN